MSFTGQILAQAAPAIDKLTVGNLITGMLFLLTVFGSLAMIVNWVVRFVHTGHALPAARRGILRVPLPLTIVAIVLSVLLMILVLLSAIIPEPVAVGVGNATASAAVESQDTTESSEPEPTATGAPPVATGAEPDTAATSESAEASAETPPTDGSVEEPKSITQKKSNLTPEQMKSALIQTIAMDLIMFMIFGAVIYVANKAGRVPLRDETTPQEAPPSRLPSNVRSDSARPGFTTSGMWPDLDDASSIPSMPGYDILGNRSGTPNIPAAIESSGVTSTGGPAEKVNPFAVIEESGENRDGEPGGESRPIQDEAFSFFTELRFAAEVFLAAYVPTTLLRFVIVMISIAISGETPASHPFLEMLNSGISVSMLAMILVTAVVFAPIVEELQFRVVILGGIAQFGRPGIALGLSTFLFAFAHGFPDSIALVPLALALGYAYLRRRSYITVMLVHLLFNGFNMILALVAML